MRRVPTAILLVLCATLALGGAGAAGARAGAAGARAGAAGARAGAAGARAGAAGPRAGAPRLLPLAPGQLRVLLGQSGEWRPEAGTPLTLTLLAGPPRARHAAALIAYVAVVPSGRTCARSPAAAHRPVLDLGPLYLPGNLVADQASSPLAPTGGATPGVYAISLPGIVIGGARTTAVRTCTWLDTTPRRRAPAIAQDIGMLNGLFAAAAWPAGSPASSVTFDAQAVAASFGYAVTTATCGTTAPGPHGIVGPDQTFSYEASITSLDCPTDATTVTFSGAASVSLPYADATARAHPAPIAHAGGCDLAGVAGLAPADARRYVAAVGCRAGRLLSAPYDGATPRGTVTEAQVDGGIAPLAPAGTTVDLVLDGA